MHARSALVLPGHLRACLIRQAGDWSEVPQLAGLAAVLASKMLYRRNIAINAGGYEVDRLDGLAQDFMASRWEALRVG